MARILFALELGAELGHVRACGALASSLEPRGHQVAFVLSDHHAPEALPPRLAADILRVWTTTTSAYVPRPASYAEVLVGFGWIDGETLAPLAQSWRKHFEAWKPDLVISEYAPTAMLTARALGIPCIHLGTGFTVPPHLDPLPGFRFDEMVEPQRIPHANERALAAANAVLAGWNAAPLERLSQLFECAEEFLCTFPELDHYGQRPESGYWGPMFDTSSGARVAWPAGRSKRVFVYLRPRIPHLDALLGWLARSPLRVVAFIPGLEEARRTRLASPLRQLSSTPIRLDGLLADCDLAVTHGGTLCAGLASLGIPQLVFPQHFEQYITARRMQQLGCGLWLGGADAPAKVGPVLHELLTNPAYPRAARSLRMRYPAFSQLEQRRRMVVRIEEVIRGAAARQVAAGAR